MILIELFADSLFIDPIRSAAALQQITGINKSEIKRAETQVHRGREHSHTLLYNMVLCVWCVVSVWWCGVCVCGCVSE